MPENMSKEEQRRAHRDERKRQNQKRMRIFYVAIIVVVLVIGLVLSFTVFFHVNKMEVRGYSIYTEGEVLGVSGVNEGDNLFLINRNKVKEHITQKLPYIGEVSVKISLPNKLIITVHETSIRCAVESPDGYVLLNEDAKVLGTAASIDDIYANAVLEGGKAVEIEAEAETETEEVTEVVAEVTEESSEEVTEPAKEEKSKTVYVLANKEFIVLKGASIKSAIVGKTVEFKTEKEVTTFCEIMNLFIENEITGITELNVSDVYNIVMRYEDRIDVKVGSVTNLKDKMAFAAQVIKDQDAATPNQAGVIDLTIDKKAYFQPETTTVETTTAAETTPEGETVATTKQGETTEPQTNSSGKKIQVATTTAKQ